MAEFAKDPTKVLAVESVYKILWSYHSNKTSSAVDRTLIPIFLKNEIGIFFLFLDNSNDDQQYELYQMLPVRFSEELISNNSCFVFMMSHMINSVLLLWLTG